MNTVASALNQHPGASFEAQRLINESIRTKSSYLDLSSLVLRFLPKELAQLAGQLTILDLSECRELVSLEGIETLSGLTSLNISGCRKITNLAGVAKLTNLNSLNARECYGLTDIEGIENLTSLKNLDLSNGIAIKSLEGIKHLKILTSLNLSGCQALTSLEVVEHLSLLTVLNLSSCQRLASLIGIEKLISLTSLSIRGCGVLRGLDEIGQLILLTSLDVSRCQELTSVYGIENLKALTSLHASGCNGLKSLNGIEHLTSLNFLDISYCQRLVSFVGIEQLTALTNLNISWCQAVDGIDSIKWLTRLTSLDVRGCNSLTSFSNIKPLVGLITLNASWCHALRSLEGIEQFKELISLDVRGCQRLKNLDGIERLDNITSLDISRCQTILSINGVNSLSKLNFLNMCDCQALITLKEINRLKFLTVLNVSGCHSLINFDDIKNFKHLKSLDVSGCGALSSLKGFDQLHLLTYLNLSGCHGLAGLNEINNLTSLRILKLSDCDSLSSIECFNQLTALTELDISYCCNLADLTGIEKFKKLISLCLSGCSALHAAEDLKYLTSLQKLEFSDLNTKLSPDMVSDIFLNWPRLKKWSYSDLCIEHVPIEIINDFSADIFEDWWLAGQQQGFASSKQIKIMLLGNGRVGKTQLMHRLCGGSFDENIPSTHGIQIQTLSYHQMLSGKLAIKPSDPDVQLQWWDFGGQDVYLGTHSLFLDAQAVYVLLWHPENENSCLVECESLQIRNRPLSFWLEYLKSLVGGKANIIICQSKCDTPEMQRVAPVPNPPPFSLLRQISINSISCDGLEQFYPPFKQALLQQITCNNNFWLPNGWLMVEQDIRHLIKNEPSRKQMSYADYECLCEKYYVTAKKTLINYMHKRGVLFYRASHFNNQIILDPQWALQGVYLLLEREQVLPELRRLGGKFDRNTLRSWLLAQQLNTDDLSLFLTMMQQCGACFKVTDEYYVAPDHLPEFDPSQAAQIWHDSIAEVEIKLHYDFLHDATMRELLSKIGSVAKQFAYYWRYGCCFYEQKKQCKVWFECALLSQTGASLLNYSQPGEITLRLEGSQSVELAQYLVKSIFQCSHLGQLPEVSWLKGLPANSRDETPGGDKLSPFSQLSPSAPPPRNPAIYFSYAWGGDAAPRQQFCDELYRLLIQAYGEQNVFRDKNHMRLGDSIEAFEREIGRAPLVLMVISQAYLTSKHCLNELRLIYEYAQKDQIQFARKVIPVVLQDAKLDDDIACAEYLTRWQDQRLQLQQLIDKLKDNTGVAQRAKLQNYLAIEHSLDHCLSWLADPLTERQTELQVEATLQLVQQKIAVQNHR